MNRTTAVLPIERLSPSWTAVPRSLSVGFTGLFAAPAASETSAHRSTTRLRWSRARSRRCGIRALGAAAITRFRSASPSGADRIGLSPRPARLRPCPTVALGESCSSTVGSQVRTVACARATPPARAFHRRLRPTSIGIHGRCKSRRGQSGPS